MYAFYGDKNKTIEKYDDSKKQWEVLSIHYAADTKPLGEIRNSVVVDKNIYLFSDGGIFQIYNTQTNTMISGIKPPFQCSYFGVAMYNRKIYVGAGSTNDGIDNNVYLLTTNDNQWKVAGKISVNLCGSGLVNYGNMLFFLGGSQTNILQENQPMGSIFIYRPLH